MRRFFNSEGGFFTVMVVAFLIIAGFFAFLVSQDKAQSSDQVRVLATVDDICVINNVPQFIGTRSLGGTQDSLGQIVYLDKSGQVVEMDLRGRKHVHSVMLITPKCDQ